MPTKKAAKKAGRGQEKTGQAPFFSKELMRWNEEKNTRLMPWKGEKDPYKIWLSEVMLQQTRVEQGWHYYLRFVKQFPTVATLAAAKDEAVFKLWEGLGYYSRCRNLLAAARQIMTAHGGKFPTHYSEIIQLKGVGAYTAAAIASFAFSQNYAVVDGNVIRLLARYFGIEQACDSTEGKKKFANLAQELIDPNDPSAYNQAIMDFGATVCKPAAPACSDCPLQKKCVALASNKISQLPVKTKKIQKRERWLYYAIIHGPKGTLVKERLGKDIWKHLFDFPGLERTDFAEFNTGWWEKWLLEQYGIKATCRQISAPLSQVLTHQNIKAVFIQFTTRAAKDIATFEWATDERLALLPFPKIIRDHLGK
ncbi:MAG TPA: A/G-specific adenine glycosylase [Phnomibacter sp.]|nr:A/G-specific adenine glycosylase [Phnomibacter sp.]